MVKYKENFLKYFLFQTDLATSNWQGGVWLGPVQCTSTSFSASYPTTARHHFHDTNERMVENLYTKTTPGFGLWKSVVQKTESCRVSSISLP